MKLKPCPCGETPLHVVVADKESPAKWKYVSGSCCQEWEVEFRSKYMAGIELHKLALEAWNNAPRGKKNEQI